MTTAAPESYTDDQIIHLFAERRRERLEREWGAYQPKNPIASDLSDCQRYQVVRVLAWEVRDIPNEQGLSVIEQGRVMEAPMIQQLREEGWEVVEDQSPITIERRANGHLVPVLTGRMDGKLRLEREFVPFDTKDTSQYTLDRVHSESDLKHSMWTRKWERQLQVYMLGADAERAVLYLGFRGDRRPIIIHRNQAGIAQIVEQCTEAVEMIQSLRDQEVGHETVDRALAELGIPYHNDFNVCRYCPFRDRACYPPQPSRQTAHYRPDLADMTERLIEAKPTRDEYEKLMRALKKETDGIETTIAGTCVIEREEKQRRMKAQPAKEAYIQSYWSFSATRVDSRDGQGSEEEAL